MIVRLDNGKLYKVEETKRNIDAFHNPKADSFFVECREDESWIGLKVALVDKKDVVEVLLGDDINEQ